MAPELVKFNKEQSRQQKTQNFTSAGNAVLQFGILEFLY